MPAILNASRLIGEDGGERPEAFGGGRAAGDIVIELPKAGGPQGRGPAQPGRKIAELQHRKGRPARNAHERRRGKAQPVAVGDHQLGERDALRPGHLHDLTARSARRQPACQQPRQVVDRHRPEQLIAADNGDHAGQAGEAADQGRAAIGFPRDDQGRADHQPVERRGLEQRFTGAFVGRVGRAGVGVDAHGGEMDHAADRRAFAGLHQRRRAVDVRRPAGVAQCVLQHADAIDDRIHAIEQRSPCFRVGEFRKIGAHPVQPRVAAPGAGHVPGAGAHLPACPDRLAGHPGADEAAGAEDQDAHGGSGRAP